MSATRIMACALMFSPVLASCERPSPDAASPPFDPVTTTDRWVTLWNTYDLSLVDSLFLTDGRVTYFSSERNGLIRGIDSVRAHHAGFGFAVGGANPGNRLWLEDVHTTSFGEATIVAGTWVFERGGTDPVERSRGPVTFVWVRSGPGFRIAHVHFANEVTPG